MKTIERIFDVVTGETTDIERDMTSQEIADYQANKLQAEQKAQQFAEAETKRAAAEAKLAALGLTADDLKALGLGGN
jgi:hypothetical protein